jgi:4-alpha-glucanotransferase
VPGTGSERSNWRRKMAHGLEEIAERDDVRRGLERLDTARRSAT